MANKHEKCIAVIGSLNIDFITRTPRIPDAGETLTAHSFDTGFGGKGANQAVACARLAGEDVRVRMVGNVGDDIFGNDYMNGLAKEQIDTAGVKKLAGQQTGVANIIVDESSGENRILFTANANYSYSSTPDKSWDLVPEEAQLVVFQMEIPEAVVLHNLHLARKQNKHTLLNPAPAFLLPESAYPAIDTLILNETESRILASSDPSSKNLSPRDLALLFLRRGVRDTVIVTLGGDGVVYASRGKKKRSSDAGGAAEDEGIVTGEVPARKVEVVDTTAAGDTFVGGFAVKRVKGLGEGADEGFGIAEALEFATKAAAKTVERNGAMGAIPFLREL